MTTDQPLTSTLQSLKTVEFLPSIAMEKPPVLKGLNTLQDNWVIDETF